MALAYVTLCIIIAVKESTACFGQKAELWKFLQLFTLGPGNCGIRVGWFLTQIKESNFRDQVIDQIFEHNVWKVFCCVQNMLPFKRSFCVQEIQRSQDLQFEGQVFGQVDRQFHVECLELVQQNELSIIQLVQKRQIILSDCYFHNRKIIPTVLKIHFPDVTGFRENSRLDELNSDGC